MTAVDLASLKVAMMAEMLAVLRVGLKADSWAGYSAVLMAAKLVAHVADLWGEKMVSC